MAKECKRRAEIRESLQAQLRGKGAAQPHFLDLTEDYLRLWDVKEALVEDIRKRGVSYTDYSSTGVPMQKNNPSVKELHGTNRQMLSILKELGLTTAQAVEDPDGDI